MARTILPEKSGYMAGKIMAELSRGLKTYTRYRAWLISDFISWPFWIIFFFLSILMYAPNLLGSKSIINYLTWGFFTFNFVSAFVWGATSVVLAAQQGIIENLILSKTSIRIHLLGRSVITAIDITVGGSVLLFFSAVWFGAEIYVADPLSFTLSIALAFIFFLSFASILSSLLIAMRSPWIIANIVQFVVPFTSGAIPVQILPGDAARIVMLSPFFYIIHPIIASATGAFFIQKETILLMAALLTILMYIASVYVEKLLIKKALKEGKMTLF